MLVRAGFGKGLPTAGLGSPENATLKNTTQTPLGDSAEYTFSVPTGINWSRFVVLCRQARVGARELHPDVAASKRHSSSQCLPLRGEE